MQRLKERAAARGAVCHLASVISSKSWCAALIAVACANATHEPLATRSSPSDEMDDASLEAAAGQPNEAQPAANGLTWCDARIVLEAYCERCHGSEPSNGAPFSLVTYDDTQVLNRRGKPRFEAIAAAVEGELMPPTYLELSPPIAQPNEDERALLVDWALEGAPLGADADCASDE